MFTPGEGISRIFCASTYKKRQKRSKMSKVVKENENVISLKIGRNSVENDLVQLPINVLF
ncbi:hypothetical protein T4B_750 [Trichinella pseudospiralis]|uniref:Uncharacterized protein n=1 Tax=Trichinella pseudospiralis TaxID=6337 RepID=A0A0V1GIE3_TRIPS|nr:hypothetical protein T4B_750 [Trichinella pseudospiralis]KRY98020.1 hypothetical protein T4C_6973 [Trichinella pseudospiralis]